MQLQILYLMFKLEKMARVHVEVMNPTGTSKLKIISVPVKQNELIKQINKALGELANPANN